MTQLKLRPYQVEALDALTAAWADTADNRLAVVLPTGMGKTVIFAELVRRSHAAGIKPIILVHRDELVTQAVEKLHSAAPSLTIGVVKAARAEIDVDVIVASVQTLARPARRAGIVGVGLVIIDECHHAAANTYLDIMRHFGCLKANGTPTAGFTATMQRGDKRGLGDVWQKVVYTKDILDGIRSKYLVDVKGRLVTVDDLDLATVARNRGDYAEGSLGDALVQSGAGRVIADAYVEHAATRQGILFTPTVASAYSFADDFRAVGISTEVIEGATPAEDRALIYKRYRAGEVQLLATCMVLTEGFDMPQASVAVIARPTTSAALYAQMVGRVLRPCLGKTSALVLDVVGVSARLPLATLVDLTKTQVREIKEGETLGDAADRELREIGSPPDRLAGVVGADDVDLFHRSRSAWLQTAKGVYFIPTRDAIFFLWPREAGKTVAVGRVDSRSTKWILLLDDVTAEYGRSWAESFAEEADPSIAQKAAPWRTRRAKPSEAQMNLATMLNIDVSDAPSKAELSDRISIFYASRAIDRHVK